MKTTYSSCIATIETCVDWESIRFQFIVSFDLQQIVWSWVPVRPCKRNTNVSRPHFCIKKRERAFSDFFINWPFEFFLDKLRANVCNFRQSVDSREFFNFFIYCPNNLYSTLISKITLKLVTAFYFFRNQAKFENL